MNRSLIVLGMLALSVGCAGAQNQPAAAAPTQAPAGLSSTLLAGVASKLNINPTYVEIAATTAQSLVGQGTAPADAAARGTEQAALRASGDGTPLTPLQTGGLTEELTSLLTGAHSG